MERIVKGYCADDALRRSFDALAQRTFGLTFEDWYQNGFWGDDYVPYSVVVDGEVAANVSVNRTDFVLDGEKKRFIQLGTVMTDERYRATASRPRCWRRWHEGVHARRSCFRRPASGKRSC